MKKTPIKQPISRDSVFVAGGQPSVTYVGRDHLKIEDMLKRALKVPNQIVSLAGPTKTGKTVLVRQVLDGAPYVWIEGGPAISDTLFIKNWKLVRKAGKAADVDV